MNKDNQLIENKKYIKSNQMVAAKYNSSLLENQVTAIGLTRIEEDVKDSEFPFKAKLYPGELAKLVSDKAHIYRDLKKLAKSIIGHTMFIEDGKGNFKAFSVIPNADYTDGVLVLKFNPELKNHLFNLEKGWFTTLEISIMTKFKKNSSFRIYELLKKDMYRSNPMLNNGRVDVEYNLFEFRFMIGIANADNTDVKKYTDSVSVIDWEKAYRILEEKGSKSDIKYKTTDKLQKNCLEPAREELELVSDIKFNYELVRIGLSYKKIVFHSYPNIPNDMNEIKNRQLFVEEMNKNNRQLEFPMDLNSEIQGLYEEYTGHNELTKEDIDLLIRKADYNVEAVKNAIIYTDQQEEVHNYMGYIIRTIEGGWKATEVVNGSAELAKAYNELSESVKNLEDDLLGDGRLTQEESLELIRENHYEPQIIIEAKKYVDSYIGFDNNYVENIKKVIKENLQDNTETEQSNGLQKPIKLLHAKEDEENKAVVAAKGLWERQKTKEEFEEFLEYMKDKTGISDVEELEAIYNYQYQDLARSFMNYALRNEM